MPRDFIIFFSRKQETKDWKISLQMLTAQLLKPVTLNRTNNFYY
jgi:hypothetical protein